VLSQCSISIYQAFDGQTEFSRVFNFAIFSYSRKFDAREKYVFYSIIIIIIKNEKILVTLHVKDVTGALNMWLGSVMASASDL